MLASLTGDLCLLLGLLVLLLPLLATELSRPRDGVWGAVVLLLGLVLVTSSDRLRGAPMLAVVCASLLIARLGTEVGQNRWNQLTPEEQQRLGSRERWTTSLQQLIAAITRLAGNAGNALTSLKPAAPADNRPEGSNRSGKRWVRPEPAATTDTASQAEDADAGASSAPVKSAEDDPERTAEPNPTAEPQSTAGASKDG